MSETDDDTCPSCGCPTTCPEGRIDEARLYGLVVGTVVGVVCSAVVLFVIGMIAWLA